MATKQYYHDIDLVKVGQLTNARIQNVANTAALPSSPGTGQVAYQLDTATLMAYNGSAWVPAVPDIAVTGDVIFKGTVDPATSLDSQATATSGFQYVASAAGTVTMTGVTFSPSAVVEAGDVILFTSGTTAAVFQRNDVAAAEGVVGNVRLATNAEAAAGSETGNVAINPAKLSHALRTNRYTRQYTATIATITADTAFTVSHSLALTSKDAFVCNVMSSGGSAISLDVDSVDVDSLTLTSSVELTNVVVTVIGASSSEFAIA